VGFTGRKNSSTDKGEGRRWKGGRGLGGGWLTTQQVCQH